MGEGRPVKRAFFLVLFAGAGLVLTSGCKFRIPREALALSPQSLQLRQMQSRRFDTDDEKKILAACAAVLQDLEFTIEESESELGLIVVTKDRSAIQTGQVIVAALLGAPYDVSQRFRASVLTRPIAGRKNVVVRVTFQRTVWNNQNAMTRNEALTDPEHYRTFYEKLSKAVFLEAHEF